MGVVRFADVVRVLVRMADSISVCSLQHKKPDRAGSRTCVSDQQMDTQCTRKSVCACLVVLCTELSEV